MKNFTKQNFKQFTSRLSARWLIMALMLLLGTSSAWAVNTIQGNCDIYFDNSKTLWTDACIQFVIGHDGYSRTYKMTKQQDSNLYHVKLGTDNTNKWNDATYYAFIGTSSKWGDGNWGPGNIANAPHRTTTYTGTYDLNSGSSYYFVPTSSGDASKNGASFEIGTSYTQTYTVKKSESGTTGGTVQLGTTTLSTSDTSMDAGTYDLTITAPTGYNVSSVTVSGGSLTTAGTTGSNTYSGTVNVTAATTISVTYTCSPSTSIISAMLGNDGKINLKGNFNTCIQQWHGFQWRIKGNDWCQENIPNDNSGYVSIYTNVNGEDTGIFEPKQGKTYEFRTYIYGNTWVYSSETIEVSTCTSIPDNTYAIAGNNEWTGNANPVTINYDANTYGTPTIYYNGKTQVPTAVGNYPITIDVPAHNGYCASTISLGDYEITCIDVEKPDVTASATICEGQVTLSDYNGNNANTVKWYSNSACTEEVTQPVTPTDGTKYYAKAYHAASNCYSSQYSTLTFTVNPLPTISIEKTEPTTVYKYADVKLKANGDNISTVVWNKDKGTITRQPNYPDETKRAMLTYDQAGTVTVTATATSEVGCSATSSAFQVEFGEEDCSETTTTTTQTVRDTDKMEIWCREDGTTAKSNLKCYAFDKNKKKVFGDWAGSTTNTTKQIGSYTYRVWEINNISSNYTLPINVVFSNNGAKQTNDLETGEAGYQYKYWYKAASDNNRSDNGAKEGLGNEITKTVTKETTTPPAKVNPTIKTVSVTSNEDGVVTLNGMVVATGCNDQAKLGLQYKKQNQDGTWPDAYLTEEPNTKENISEGKTYTTTVTLEDGTYKVRACAHVDNTLKGYGYDIIITVSTTKTPISNVTLNYCDENCGNVGVDPNPMCKGATAYVKLEYAGSNYSDIKWLVEGVETNLVTDKGDGVWSYIIQGTGHLSVELRNDANKDNEDNPTWATGKKLSFTMKEEPAAPYISINPASGIICEGSEATIKVENPSKACSYKLVEEEDTKAGFKKYESGDLKYSVGSVGKYYVAAKHIECSTNEYTSNQVAINQIIRTSAKISIEPANAETTPWEPVTITVKPDAGYIYKLSYTDGNLAAVDGVRIKQNGDSYTYYIPRPTGWGEGNAVSVRTPVAYGIKAQLKVDGEANQCDLSFDTATITVKDEKNEDCDQHIEP